MDVKTTLEGTYPKLKESGGFELLRSGAPSSKLLLIATPPEADTLFHLIFFEREKSS